MEPTVITPLTAIADAVRGTLDADAFEPANRRLRLLDTIDRRLAARGWRLEVEPIADAPADTWRLVNGTGKVRAQAQIPHPPPRLADELPEGPLRRTLEPVIWIRSLIPGPWITVTEDGAALRDRDGKVRCRLVAQTAVTEGAGEQRSGVRVEPLKGYRRDSEKIAKRIATRFGWSPSGPDALTALAEALHAQSDESDEPSVTDAREAAGPALRVVLLALLDVIERRRVGVIADIDCEELHELRVAIRRTRSILSLLRTPEPDARLDHARETFAWLGRVTGPTRDLDVHILAWRAHRRQASAGDAAALEPFGRFLMDERAKAHAALTRTLATRRLASALARWRRALSGSEATWTRFEILRRPVGVLAGRRILKLYRRALQEGTGITPETPAEALHALRKTMKKLRYVIEIVRDVYPARRVRALLRTLRQLQQVLGDVQDMEVQAAALRRFGQVMGDSGTAGPATLMAIGAQAEDLEIHRAEARARFAEVFAPVAKPRFGKRLTALTRSGIGAPE
ncbi:CHAD domain-containing protein [Thalassobaculum sp.]|uniref:CHAD domain-containing protein n=1 Tax=Thalassobaculum sp. TaxID=2022740 RepID=UPI0032EB75EB